MSLVGNLEDLSLGDILQIVSLSQKSGVLALASDHGSGRIVFRQGLVHAACLKGRPNNLRDLLVSGRFIDPAGFDASHAHALDQGIPIEQALVAEAELTTERIDALVQESTEAAIQEMFCWPNGDFSFDVRSQLDPDDPQLILSNGLNAQYLAMEALRLGDERARDSGGESGPKADASPMREELAEDPIFGSDLLEIDDDPADPEAVNAAPPPLLEIDPLAGDGLDIDLLGDDLIGYQPQSDAVAVILPVAKSAPVALPEAEFASPAGVLVARVIERAEAANEPVDLDFAEDVHDAEMAVDVSERALDSEPPLAELRQPASMVEAALVSDPAAASVVQSMAESARAFEDVPPLCLAKKMPVVLIEPDMTVLEWVKSAIEDEFARVHVFQHADQGLARIRQYLIRGEVPLVLISSATRIDPLSGIHGLSDFVKRLKAQAPKLVILGLREDADVAPSAMPGTLNGVLRRPERLLLADRSQPEGEMASRVLARALLEILAHQGVVDCVDTAPTETASNQGRSYQDRSKQAEAATPSALVEDAMVRLQEASSQSEILPVVLDFAAIYFARVAMLTIRQAEVFAIAGRGIPALEVDPLDSAPPIALPITEQGWIRQVLDTGKPQVSAAMAESDRLLLGCLGSVEPREAFLAPIESGSSVIAILYADQAASDAPMPDTTRIEEVLHLAGLALDRAALGRALWEVDADVH